MEQVSITDVCNFQGGTQPPKSLWKKEFEGGYIRMLQIRDFTQPEKNNVEFVPYKETLKTCNEEDILIGRYGASVGKICTGLAGAYNVALIKTLPDLDHIDRKFFLHLLRGTSFQNFILNVGGRAAQAGFNKDDLREFKFYLPTLPQQKKIAAILDAADAYRQKTKALIEKYDELTQSLFLEMFGDTRNNPMNWAQHELVDVCDEVIDCPHSTPRYVSQKTDYPCIRTTELDNGIINWSKMKYLDYAGYVERTKRLLPESGDVIYGREGTFGEAAIVPNDCKMSLGQRVMLFRPRQSVINSSFLHAVVRSKGVYHQALRVNSGSTVGHVNVKDIKKFKLVVPPLVMQDKFAKRVKDIKIQKAQAQTSLAKAEDLFNSLLQRAFKGDIN